MRIWTEISLETRAALFFLLILYSLPRHNYLFLVNAKAGWGKRLFFKRKDKSLCLQLLKASVYDSLYPQRNEVVITILDLIQHILKATGDFLLIRMEAGSCPEPTLLHIKQNPSPTSDGRKHGQPGNSKDP